MECVTHRDYAWFVTFTYNDEALPITLDVDGAPVPTLEKKTFLKWLNNQTADLGPFRYYSVGEYGDLSGRPHYHAAVFPQSIAQVSALADQWERQFGFTTAAPLNTQRARYLAQYTTKKLTAADDDRLKGCQQPEFRTSSRNPPLGHEFAEQLIEHYTIKPTAAQLVAERGDIERSWRFDGHVYPIGGYVLNYVRKGLGIPLLHRDRAQANPNYLDWHEVQEAEWNPREANDQRIKADAKKTQRLYRTTAAKL